MRTSGLRTPGSGLRAARLVIAVLAPIALTGCRQDMHDNPRSEPLEESRVFADRSASRVLVAGTVPRGHLNDDDFLYTGKMSGQPVTEFPFAITRTDLDRGQERFNIYCSPCHSRLGDGRGMVVLRGHRQPPSFHIDRLRQAPPGYVFDVITNGFGAMPDYRAQITPEDRWRVIAYLKALQLSQNATMADVPEAERGHVSSGGAAGAEHQAPPRQGGH